MSALEEPSRRLPRQARAMWWLTGGSAALLATAVVMSVVREPAVTAAVAVAGALAAYAVPELLWRRWRFEIREDEIDLRHGVLTVRRTLVPIRRVQHVDTESGPLQGLFGLATVRFHTAAGRTSIPALTQADAEQVRRRVGELARTRDDV